METWFIIIVSLCISVIIKYIFPIIQSTNTMKLPPGPTKIPVIGSFIWLHRSLFQLQPILQNLKLKYGPTITLRIGSLDFIFIADRSLAPRALVQSGATFSDRPQKLFTGHTINSHQTNISSSAYGPNWRLFRRNIAEIIHPVRLKTYSSGRRRVLRNLLQRLLSESGSESIKVVDHLRHATFSLLVVMCFEEGFDENRTREIENVHKKVLSSFSRFSVLNIWPKLGRIIFWKRRKDLVRIREERTKVLIPIIRARAEKVMMQNVQKDNVMAYVDSLVDLKLPEEGNRILSDGDMVSLCWEFLTGGSDTTSTTLQWIMANLVKYPRIQNKLYQEIVSVVGRTAEESMEKVAKEEELQRMPYLKAVVLECLRRHPPSHFVLPHSVVEEVELGGYVIPKNAVVNFMVADMGQDSEVWKDPMEFRPERFLGGNVVEQVFDITGSREIKMMPFGAGRRICPGYTLALLHLEYFVANLVLYFEWKPAVGVENNEVDLSEKQEFTVGMNSPLLVCISPRVK